MRPALFFALLALTACESAADEAARLSREGEVALEADDLPHATELFVGATTADPTGLPGWRGLCRAHARGDRWPEAATAADRCLTLIDDPECRQTRADAAAHAEDWARAIEDYGRALSLDPTRSELYLARARASAHLPDAERTDGFYREAIDHDAEPVGSRVELARILLDRCGAPERVGRRARRSTWRSPS